MSSTISDSLRLEIMKASCSGLLKRVEICKEYGISRTTLYRILSSFAPENNLSLKMSSSLETPSLSDSESELLDLRLRIKELEHKLRQAEMARDAYNLMIELAEERYHIRVRKNFVAK